MRSSLSWTTWKGFWHGPACSSNLNFFPNGLLILSCNASCSLSNKTLKLCTCSITVIHFFRLVNICAKNFGQNNFCADRIDQNFFASCVRCIIIFVKIIFVCFLPMKIFLQWKRCIIVMFVPYRSTIFRFFRCKSIFMHGKRTEIIFPNIIIQCIFWKNS